MIPKLSHPLAKSVRTLEGVLVLAANVALVVIPAVTNSLSAGNAVKYGVILNSAYAIARSLLKGIAAAGSYGAPAPTQLLSPQVQRKLAGDAAAIAEQATQDAQHGASLAKVLDQAATDEAKFAQPDPLDVGPSAADLAPPPAPSPAPVPDITPPPTAASAVVTPPPPAAPGA